MQRLIDIANLLNFKVAFFRRFMFGYWLEIVLRMIKLVSDLMKSMSDFNIFVSMQNTWKYSLNIPVYRLFLERKLVCHTRTVFDC